MLIFSFCVPSSSSSSSLSLFFFVLVHISFHVLIAYGKKPATVPALLVFGDSIVDPGNNNKLASVVRCDFPPYGQDFVQQRPTGRFCNGKIPSDFIAAALGLKEYLPAYLDPDLKPEDLLTGVSFASGGCGYDDLTSKLVSVFSLHDQIAMFKEYVERLKTIAGGERAATIISGSLFITIVGSDDIANTYFSTPFRKKNYDIPSYVELLVNSAMDFYGKLYELGARKIGVVSLPPVGCVPAQRTLAGGITRDCVEKYNRAARTVNSRLSDEVQKMAARHPELNMVYIDIYTILDNLVKHPTSYGFEISNKGCCGTGNIEVAVLCNRLTPPCGNVTKYVFFDGYHPTERAYKVITDTLKKDYLPRLH